MPSPYYSVLGGSRPYPLNITGLQWFLDFDDSVVSGGRISTITDRLQGASFAGWNTLGLSIAPDNGNPVANTTDRASHTVMACNTFDAFHSGLINSTLGSALNGTQSFSAFAYLHLRTTANGSTYFTYSNGSAFNNASEFMQVSNNGGNLSLTRSSAVNAHNETQNSSANTNSGITTGYHSFAWTYDGPSKVVSFYKDGSFLDSKTFTNSISLVGMTCVQPGCGFYRYGPSQNKELFQVMFMTNTVMSSSDISTAHTFVVANY